MYIFYQQCSSNWYDQGKIQDSRYCRKYSIIQVIYCDIRYKQYHQVENLDHRIHIIWFFLGRFGFWCRILVLSAVSALVMVIYIQDQEDNTGRYVVTNNILEDIWQMYWMLQQKILPTTVERTVTSEIYILLAMFFQLV